VTENRQKENFFSYVKAVWRRAQTLHVTAGALALCRWIIPLFLAVMAIDWLTDLPAVLRAAFLAGLLSVSVYKAWKCGWLNVRSFNAAHTALRIEEHLGGLESLLVTAVQFRESALCPGTSESMRDMTCHRAEEAVVPLRPADAVVYLGLRRPATVAIVLALIVGVFAVVNGPVLAAGAARIFAPWMAVRYPTRTQLDMTNGDMIVREGGVVRIQARVSGVIPSRARLALRTGKGKSRKHELVISDGVCEYTIESVFRGFEYRILAGDARSDWYSVQVIPSPRIASAEVSIEFPPYTDRPTETVEALTLTVPEGTRIKWRLSLDRAVSKANYNPAGGKTQVLDVSEDGRTVTMRQVATQSRAYSFSWVEREYGFAFTGPSHHLQVMPDQQPHVELTSPRGNLYATLGRRLVLAFRGRDDHGIGESVVAYRVNKTGEEKVRFPAPTLGDGGEHRIDWDYRTVLPDLAVGDTISFVVELTDRYPGPEGPHRVRSAARRMTFLSREDYLAHIAKQKRRLLLRLRAIYREQRAVHDIVRRLDPSDPVFLQTCQLEAVRQNLLGERMGVLARAMAELVDDLAANNIPDETHSAALGRLCADIRTIVAKHVGGAADSFRGLAAASGDGAAGRVAGLAVAVHQVNTAGRELGCLILQLGYRDASEVMARELHATAQTQATLRLRTIMPQDGAGTERLSQDQQRLAQWLRRLLAATPRETESTVEEALEAFNLSRLVRRLQSTGVDAGMHEAVALIGDGATADAVRLQAEAIQALLHAEFRLRVGSEYEALSKARELFLSLAAGQKALRAEISGLTAEELSKRRSEFQRAQVAVQRQLQLLLMPSIPAPRPRLFDAAVPAPPPVHDLLATAESALKGSVARMATGDPGAGEQMKAEKAFEALAEIVRLRTFALTQAERIDSLAVSGENQAMKVEMLQERLLGLLEKTEDAAADRAGSARLARQAQALADDVETLRLSIVRGNDIQASPGQDNGPLLVCLGGAVGEMTRAVAAMKDNMPSQAISGQGAALKALEEAGRLITEQTANHSIFAAVIEVTRDVLTPSPQLTEIEAEQRDMMEATRKAKPEDLAGLVIPQKNLVHAVNVVLNSLDTLAHRIESGTVMLFAKSDMDEAGVALEEKDVEEALDAQSYVADTLRELREKIDAVTPEYRYVLEVVEFLHEVAPENPAIRAGMRRLREEMAAPAGADVAANLDDRRRALEDRARQWGDRLRKLTGQQRYAETASRVTKAVGSMQADANAAGPRMEEAAGALAADAADLRKLMENLAYLMAPPPDLSPSDAGPRPEVKLVRDVLSLAAHHKDLYRKTQTAPADQMADLAKVQHRLEKQCAAFVPASGSHPNLVAAKRHISEAAAKLSAGSRAEAIASQHEAGEVLRYFLLEYALKYVEIPPPDPAGPDGPPVLRYEVEEQDISIFMPGAVSGRAPKGGRQEWEVLGRRERAALNENFARELPLEYRAILKDYYERLTR